MLTHRRPTASRRRAATALVVAGAAVTGCSSQTTCPAILHGHTLTVALADGWQSQPGRTLHVECSRPCDDGPAGGRSLVGRSSVSVSGSAASTAFGFTLGAPDSVVLTVLDAAGTELARVEVEPEWVRVGGSEECGGPSEATVTVPAP